LAVSWFFLFRAVTDNPFASALVLIQTERGHRVVSTGVYSLVRHPMYLGRVLSRLPVFPSAGRDDRVRRHAGAE